MQLIKNFLKDTDDNRIKESESTIIWFYKENLSLIPKDEIEDFEQDIILTILESIKKYNSEKGKFSTYLMWNFKTYKQSLITRFTGIKMNYKQCKDLKKNGINYIKLIPIE